jgi:hypothetical protein
MATGPAAPWRAIAALGDAALEAGFGAIRLRVLADAPGPVTALDCREAIVAATLRADDAREPGR